MEKDRKGSALNERGGADKDLSEEERALWDHTARDLKPIKKKKGYVHSSHEPAVDRASRRPKPVAKVAVPKTQPRSPQSHAIATTSPRAPPPLSELDRRRARKIGTGRIAIEGRIDLHGMRQSKAHAALRRFLLGAHTKNRRWVLVITGKGSTSRARTTEAEGDLYVSSEPGILKRNVPRWLNEPDLRTIVVSYTTAAQRHGGEGALYVQLRKRSNPNENE